jgi:hypothetical protein
VNGKGGWPCANVGGLASAQQGTSQVGPSACALPNRHCPPVPPSPSLKRPQIALREMLVLQHLICSFPSSQSPPDSLPSQHSSLPQVILDTLEFGSKIKKTPVVVGNCTGFAVNRNFFPYTMVRLGFSFFLAMCGMRVCGLPQFSDSRVRLARVYVRVLAHGWL